MKILHVLAHVSPDGAYGGPATVALQQLSELAARGHDVTLVAGADRSTIRLGETTVGGVQAKLFRSWSVVPGYGFGGRVSPSLMLWVRRQARNYDVVHFHLPRDLVVLPANLLANLGLRSVVQPHGMIASPKNSIARTIDLLGTRRALTQAGAVICLSESERHAIEGIVSAAKTTVIPNGMSAPIGRPDRQRRREILFLARMHPRKNPLLFVEAAAILLAQGVDAQFTLVGPAGGAEDAVQRRISSLGTDKITWEGGIPQDKVVERMSEALLYVLPALSEPFGMTILEALYAGLPVVIGRDSELASFILENDLGAAFDGSAESLAAQIMPYLETPGLARDQGSRAAPIVERTYGIARSIDMLEKTYVDIALVK